MYLFLHHPTGFLRERFSWFPPPEIWPGFFLYAPKCGIHICVIHDLNYKASSRYIIKPTRWCPWETHSTIFAVSARPAILQASFERITSHNHFYEGLWHGWSKGRTRHDKTPEDETSLLRERERERENFIPMILSIYIYISLSLSLSPSPSPSLYPNRLCTRAHTHTYIYV